MTGTPAMAGFQGALLAALQPSCNNKLQNCFQKSIITMSTAQSLHTPPGVKNQAQQENSIKTNMIEAMHLCC
jgi:hypothetical protein